MLAAAERTGALLVTLENLYGYGPTGGEPITEDLPLAADTVKGRTRAAMTRELLAAADAGRVRIAIGRASDFFGPGVTASALGERFFAHAVSGKKADFLGNPNLRHTYSYVPDIAHGLATLGNDERAVGQVLAYSPVQRPSPPVRSRRSSPTSSNEAVDLRIMPRPLLSMLAVVSPLLRALKEMAYEFEEPFVLDTTKYESTLRERGHSTAHRSRRHDLVVPQPHQLTTAHAAMGTGAGHNGDARGAPWSAACCSGCGHQTRSCAAVMRVVSMSGLLASIL